eukprot:13256848-Alexandrium_andersonii.AAC.1
MCLGVWVREGAEHAKACSMSYPFEAFVLKLCTRCPPCLRHAWVSAQGAVQAGAFAGLGAGTAKGPLGG